MCGDGARINAREGITIFITILINSTHCKYLPPTLESYEILAHRKENILTI